MNHCLPGRPPRFLEGKDIEGAIKDSSHSTTFRLIKNKRKL